MNVPLHPVYFDVSGLPGLSARLAHAGKTYSAVYVLADGGIPEAVRCSFLDGLPPAHVHTVPGGETAKTFASVQGIWEFLLHVRADRHALLVNLGGGAVCDAGGFAASTFKRGIDFVHVPSTLLSMTDASVGGKTGINTGGTKNSVGTFAMPAAVFIHVPLLHTLAPREMLSGYAEMLKHGLVANASHLHQVLHKFTRGGVPPENMIRDSVEIKSAIVGRDPHENGERKLLNFGHTVGHGLESYLSGIPGAAVLHGEAVAAGMLAEMHVSGRALGYPETETERFRTLLQPLTRHVRVTADMVPGIMEKIGNDKKNEGGQIGMTLLNKDGRGQWGMTAPAEWVEAAILSLVP